MVDTSTCLWLNQSMSPHNLRQIANNLSAFGWPSIDRQLAIHVANGDLTEREAATVRDLVANSDDMLLRDMVHAI